jgi:hypothetical protein
MSIPSPIPCSSAAGYHHDSDFQNYLDAQRNARAALGEACQSCLTFEGNLGAQFENAIQGLSQSLDDIAGQFHGQRNVNLRALIDQFQTIETTIRQTQQNYEQQR